MAQVDPQNLTPEQFIEMVKTASDEQIVEAIHAAGTEQALEGIFAGMKESFRPERAGDQDAGITWAVVDDGTEHTWTLAIHGGTCEARKGAAENPTVTLTMDLVTFVKMIAGQANGTQLFMSGKLKLSGDMMYAMKIESLFERPGA
jgi:alkyl sulfatase BDS1-like metallo-beta-lactamase superfamily hydrolase